MRYLLVLITLFLQSCALYENFDDPYEGLIEAIMDEMFEKHRPDSNPIMSGYELMKREYMRQNEWSSKW